MKREMSDTDSEQDLLDDACSSPLHHTHGMDRKKRRGIIEKRRRDRINHSLTELKRLVPAAYEKQGSAKLEKAEILQMTVDHLKVLQHQKGFVGYPDPSAIAMDYRSLGFRECAGEVARYLASVEGMDSHDPLRLRLLSHLQCFSHQRESDVHKTRMTHAGGAVPPPPAAPNTWAAAAGTGGATPGSTASGGYSTASSTPSFVPEPLPHPVQAAPVQQQFSHPQQQQQQQVLTHAAPQMVSQANFSHQAHQTHQFNMNQQASSPMQWNGHHAGNAKPYRPWGTELGAY